MRELLMDARLICPLQNIDANGWLLIENGIIADSGNGTAESSIAADKITDCKGHIIGPSFVDMRVQSGYPGAEHLETMDSLLQSAASGGISTVVLLPSTLPVIDNAAIIDSLQVRADRANGPKVHCYGAMTKELKQEQMAELGLMAKAGAVGFASGTMSIQSALSMYRIMTYAAMLDKPIIHHCEDFAFGHFHTCDYSAGQATVGNPSNDSDRIILCSYLFSDFPCPVRTVIVHHQDFMGNFGKSGLQLAQKNGQVRRLIIGWQDYRESGAYSCHGFRCLVEITLAPDCSTEDRSRIAYHVHFQVCVLNGTVVRGKRESISPANATAGGGEGNPLPGAHENKGLGKSTGQAVRSLTGEWPHSITRNAVCGGASLTCSRDRSQAVFGAITIIGIAENHLLSVLERIEAFNVEGIGIR